MPNLSTIPKIGAVTDPFQIHNSLNLFQQKVAQPGEKLNWGNNDDCEWISEKGDGSI